MTHVKVGMKTEAKAVLIVDDEQDMCWALGHIFRKAGYSATMAPTGQEALEWLEQRAFPLIILDAKLPDIEGLELAVEIRKISPATRILIVSGYFYQDDAEIQQAIKGGLISGFIAKPFSHEGILNQAAKVIARVPQK